MDRVGLGPASSASAKAHRTESPVLEPSVLAAPVAWSPSRRLPRLTALQPVQKTVNDHELFIADWFGVREKHYSLADKLGFISQIRPSENAVMLGICIKRALS